MWIVAGFSAVAVVTFVISLNVIPNSLSITLGSAPALADKGLLPPCLIVANLTSPLSSVYLIGISKSSFAYT